MNVESIKIDTNEVDSLNLACYDYIASEYGDSNHETCRDFDSGTECFLKKALKLIDFKKGLRYLDVGVGTGVTLDFMMSWLENMQADIEVLDISKNMLEITKAKYSNRISKYHHTSIHNFKSDIKYDLILAALCDPYLTKETIQILKNSLTEDGVLLLTLPTHTWAKKIRKEDIYKATFHDKERNKHTSFSFCWSKGDLIKFIESSGLYNFYSKVILIDEIKK